MDRQMDPMDERTLAIYDILQSQQDKIEPAPPLILSPLTIWSHFLLIMTSLSVC